MNKATVIPAKAGIQSFFGWMPAFAGMTIIFWLSSALALSIEQPLPAGQESRAQALFHEIRCVVCQGESVADSPADVAADMRRLVRARIASGDRDDAIKNYLVSRYGDVILMNPPLKAATALLWFGPLLMLCIAISFVFSYFRHPGAGRDPGQTTSKQQNMDPGLRRDDNTI